MGQINTNNYPAVDSLLDADLLIVENATHGTGTTTPKQLRENAIGTDPLQTTAQTVTGAINEIFEMATDTIVGLELGKMTSFSDGVIVTDIDLHRAPVAGDRILFYHSAAVASPSSLTTYNDGVAVTTTIGDFSMTHPAGLTLMKCVALGESLRWQTVQDIASGYTAGVGISINGTTINNSAPQLGDDIAYSRVDTVTSGALGYFSADADCLVMDFRTDAEPYNGGYTLRLTTTGASFKYAVLKDKAGNNYAEKIPAGSLVMCKSNVSGTGSESDPVVVTVLEIGNVEMAHDVEVLKDICITEKTVSGNPITITDALPYNAVSLSAEIEASQDLHGYDHPWVGGENVQLVDFSTYASLSNNISFDYIDGDVTLTSTDTTSNYPSVVFNILNLKGKTLYFSDTFTSSDEGLGHIQIIYSVNGQQTYLEVGKNPDPQTGYTIPNDVTSADLKLYLRNGTSVASGKWVKYSKIMCAASANPTYSPYANICPISGRTDTSVDTVGRNVWDEQWEQGAYSYASTGGKNTSPNYIRNVNQIPVLPDTDYYIKRPSSGEMRVGFYAKDGSYLSSFTNVSGSGSIIRTPSNAYNITFDYTVATTYNHDICINISDASFNGQYAPYKGITVTIQLGQTVYGGTLNVTTGVLTVTHASVTLDGSNDEVWDVSNNRFRCKSLPSPCIDSASTINGTSNSYEVKTAHNVTSNRQTPDFVGLAVSNTELLVVDNVNFATDDLSAYKTYLASNNLQVVYELATPQTIQLTPAQLAMLKGYNRLSSDGGGDLSITYKADRLAAIEAALAAL